MIFSSRLSCLVSISIVLLASPVVLGQGFTFTKIVDTNTPIPGGVGNFTDFGRPVMRDGKTVFWGEGTGQGGIFLHENDAITKLVDLETVFPDVPGTIASFESVTFDGETVAFLGFQECCGRIAGVLSSDLDGTPNTVAALSFGDNAWRFPTPIKDRKLVSVHSGELAFITREPVNGIFKSGKDGDLVKVVDTATIMPDGTFLGGYFSELTLTSDALFFYNNEGIHAQTGPNDIVTYVTRNAIIPGGFSSFTGVRSLAADSFNVAFNGQGKNQKGVYLATNDNGTVVVDMIANLNSPAPEGDARFTSFADWSGIAIEGNSIAFYAETTNSLGVYFYDGSELSRILDTTQSIDGQQVVDVHLTERSIENGSIALQVDLDQSFGIYIASPTPVLPPLSVAGIGQTYLQDFDALTPLPDSPDLSSPLNWQIMIDGKKVSAVDGKYPPTTVMGRAVSAGDFEDRALAIGTVDKAQASSLSFDLEITNEPVRALRLQYDVEAWGANLNADNPGEAAFHATLNMGDDTLVDFGTTTTGTVLTPGLLNGNESPNRVSFDSGIIEIAIPVGTPAQLTWTVPQGSATDGWLLGLDNILFRTLAPGDADANGVIDVADLLTLLGGQKFNKGVDGVTWAQGDFNADDQFNTGDLLAMLAFLSGQFPSDPYASEAGAASDAVADVIVNSETGEVTVDLAGHTVSAILIGSAAEIFNGVEPNWDTTSQFPSTLHGELGNVLFTSTASGVDELGTVISGEFLGRDKEFYLQDLDLNILIASEGGALTKGNVIVVPEPSTWLLLTAGVLLVGWRQAKRSPGKQ